MDVLPRHYKIHAVAETGYMQLCSIDHKWIITRLVFVCHGVFYSNSSTKNWLFSPLMVASSNGLNAIVPSQSLSKLYRT